MPADRLRLVYFANPNETHTRRWLGWFAARGHDVAIVIAPDVEVEPGLPEKIEVRAWAPYGGGPIKPLRYLSARRSFRRVLDDLRPDVVHAHYLSYGWLAWVSGFRPYGVTTWGSDVYHDLGLSRRYSAFGRIALRGAAFVTAVSRDLLGRTVAAGARRDRAAVVQWGVEIDRFEQAPDADLRRSLHLDGQRVVFSPRTIMPLYNHEIVLRAFVQLPDNVHLLMSAKAADPDELRRITALVSDLGLGRRVTILEEIPYAEMARHHLLADACISIPRTDAGPVTMWESMAAGVPLVATDLQSLREWLDDLTPQLLVPVGDVAATAAALRAALDLGSAERVALATRLRARAAQHADHARNMITMEGIYRSVAAGSLSIPPEARL
jgi:glycosyltransferase involved in cell wall biosynthesis